MNKLALHALCADNSPVTGEFPSQRPVTLNFDDFFDLRLNKRLSKQSRHCWLETPSRSLWRHCNDHRIFQFHYQMGNLCIKGFAWRYKRTHLSWNRCLVMFSKVLWGPRNHTIREIKWSGHGLMLFQVWLVMRHSDKPDRNSRGRDL